MHAGDTRGLQATFVYDEVDKQQLIRAKMHDMKRQGEQHVSEQSAWAALDNEEINKHVRRSIPPSMQHLRRVTDVLKTFERLKTEKLREEPTLLLYDTNKTKVAAFIKDRLRGDGRREAAYTVMDPVLDDMLSNRQGAPCVAGDFQPAATAPEAAAEPPLPPAPAPQQRPAYLLAWERERGKLAEMGETAYKAHIGDVWRGGR